MIFTAWVKTSCNSRNIVLQANFSRSIKQCVDEKSFAAASLIFATTPACLPVIATAQSVQAPMQCCQLRFLLSQSSKIITLIVFFGNSRQHGSSSQISAQAQSIKRTNTRRIALFAIHALHNTWSIFLVFFMNYYHNYYRLSIISLYSDDKYNGETYIRHVHQA